MCITLFDLQGKKPGTIELIDRYGRTWDLIKVDEGNCFQVRKRGREQQVVTIIACALYGILNANRQGVGFFNHPKAHVRNIS